MNDDRTNPARMVFPLASLVSGATSGIFSAVPPGAILGPGTLFGIALVWAVLQAVESLKPAKCAAIITFSILGFWIGLISTMLSIQPFGGGNQLESDLMGGLIGGGTGACVTSVGLVIASERFRSVPFVLATTFAGAVGGMGFGVTIYLHDNANVPHPLDFIVGFTVWQVGVASIMPFGMNEPMHWHQDDLLAVRPVNTGNEGDKTGI